MKLKQRREPDSTLRRGIVCEGKYICASGLWSVEDESGEELVKLDPEAHWKDWRGEEEENQPHSYFPLWHRGDTVLSLVSGPVAWTLFSFGLCGTLFVLCFSCF